MTTKLKPYPKYKDSGIEWLGEVPEGWEVCGFKRNNSLRSIKQSFTKNDYLVALENIERFTGNYIETNSNYSGDAIGFCSKDILFGKLRPYLAKVFICNRNGVAFGDLLVYQPREVSRFTFYQMLSDWFINMVDSSTYGSKMPRASSEFIGVLSIAVPSIQEQTTIATYLDTQTAKIDQTISKAEQAIELLKEKRTALITAAVTGKIDVRECV